MTASFGLQQKQPEGELRRYFNAHDNHWRVQLMQGDSYISTSPNEILTTILGSCVSACIRDTAAQIGGMNHFLLPEGSGNDRTAMRYGVNAMELLINGLIQAGALRSRLEAKLFGGANVVQGLSDIGAQNAAFAKRFLEDEGIPVVSSDVGGTIPRRIAFWPATGRARRLAVASDTSNLAAEELQNARRQFTDSVAHDVELF